MFDGVFIHHLINELKELENKRINKVGTINTSEFFLTLSDKKVLLINVNSNYLNIRITSKQLINSPQKNNFHILLRKYLESSIIEKVYQHNNDRIIIISFISFDDLGYKNQMKLIIECFGKNSNIILLDSNDIIIDAYKRSFGEMEEERIICPKYKYKFPVQERVNPYETYQGLDENVYEGVSNLLFTEMTYQNNFNIINNEVMPVIIRGQKDFFYCFDLKHKDGERIFFNTLSECLDYFFTIVKDKKSDNNEQVFLEHYINKELNKIKNKIDKQQLEYKKANQDLIYEKKGNLLLCNLHKVRKGDKQITVEDYYDNNNKYIIDLDPLLTPNQNVENLFKKYQKAKRAIESIQTQIEKSQEEYNYYSCLLNQLKISKINDLVEIYQELSIKVKALERPKKSKPNFITYETKNGDLIFVGKNNIQNNYLTHHFARKEDYFFHVQNVPGSHVICRTNNLTKDLIYLVCCISSYYSSYRESTNVCVDYTLVKNVKKIPGEKGSFVTYKNFKSEFGKPDLEYINNNCKQKK